MARAAATRVATLLASIVRLVASLIAVVILLHAAFWFFGANPANALVSAAADVRQTFGWFTVDLFPRRRPEGERDGRRRAGRAALDRRRQPGVPAARLAGAEVPRPGLVLQPHISGFSGGVVAAAGSGLVSAAPV